MRLSLKLTSNKTKWLRKSHRWLALIAGVQILIWSVSGLYMTVIDIDIIHGDHLVKELEPSKLNSGKVVPINQAILQDNSTIQSVTLVKYFDQLVYEVNTAETQLIVSASTGELKLPLSKDTIRKQADTIYAGEARIEKIELLPIWPAEIGGRNQPVWKVSYDDSLNSAIYFNHLSGELIRKRTDLWRIFDFFWILHIMEFAGSEGYEGYLFRFFSITSLLMALFGSGLLYFRLRQDFRLRQGENQ